MIKRENFIFLLFSIISIVTGLITTYLLSNYFSVEEFGQIQLLLTFVGLFSIFYFSGFDVIIIKQIYNKNDGIVRYILKHVMPIAFIALWVLLFFIYVLYDKDLNLIFLAGCIVSLGLFDKTNAILNAKLEFKQLRYLELYTKVVLLIVASVTIIMSSEITTYLVLFSIISIIIFFVRILVSNRVLLFNSRLFFENKKIIMEGIRTSLSVSYTIIASWSERLILGFLDVEMLAIFAIGQLFTKAIKDNIKVFLLPTLSTWASKGFHYYSLMINKYQFILWFIGAMIYVINYFLVDIIISNFFLKYEESILIAQLLSITLVFKFVELAKMSSLSLSKYTYVFNKINNISNTFKIVLVIILIPIYGIYGAVFSILFVECLRFSLVTKEFSKLQKEKSK